jgi:deoxycytidylate deaminase
MFTSKGTIMTRKIYKSAQGKTVDMGALILQNEQVRAVGNMGVNAAGDQVDSNNQIIDQRNRQVQRQYNKQTDSTSKKTT